MNKQRRKNLANIIDHLDALRITLEELRDEEQDSFDALPEGFQTGERGEAMESAISSMEEALDNIDYAISSIEEAME